MAPSAAYVPALKRREAQKGGKQERVQLVLPISEITGWWGPNGGGQGFLGAGKIDQEGVRHSEEIAAVTRRLALSYP